MTMTEAKTTQASWEVREAFSNVLFAFAQDPKFKEKGPGALCFHEKGELPRGFTFSFNDPAEEPVLHDNLLKAQADIDRAVFKKGKTAEGLYVSILSNDGVSLVLFGWTWSDGLAFLLALAKQLKLEVPLQAEASFSRQAREALPEAVRVLLK